MAKELEKVDSKKVTIKIKGKERELKFGFSAWAILEREYGGIKNITKLQKAVEERPFETLPHLIYIGLVDKEGVDEDSVLDEFGLNDIEYISNKFAEALYGSLPEVEDEKKAGKEAK
jgi:hypothetical protein